MANTSSRVTKIGKNGLTVPVPGFGLMGLSQATYGSVPSDEERFAVLDRAHDLKLTFWDTADLYGDGEELLNKWFRHTGKRDEIFLSTKFGFTIGASGLGVDSSAAYCKKACSESLRRLGIDSIDLYYMHHANPKTPIEETMRALKELKTEGKIKYIGLSAISSNTLRRAVKIAPVDVVQLDYSPFTREIEGPEGTNLLATCRELGVTIVAAMPLGRGMITTNYAAGEALTDAQDQRAKAMPRFLEQNRTTNEKTIQQFQALADKKGCTTAQLSLAWLMKQGSDIIPIPGTKRVKYLEENWASRYIELSDEEEKEIRCFLDKAEIAGAALPEQFKDYNFTDTVEEA
ncbi:hypothetical protein S40293_08678 [Stachybotrys chartarum IBT 40293]|nr:hypothetical protein S40293_08678 [Stachybotrys chartarum IBT 40293]